MSQADRPIKLVLLGDDTVGKTCLLTAFATGRFPEGEHVPTVFKEYTGNMEVDGVRVSLTICDTANRGVYDDARPLCYLGTDCYLLCFSVDSNESYENIAKRWHPQVRQNYVAVVPKCRTPPYIVVCTKTDLRDSAAQGTNKNFVTQTQGKKMAAKIKASKYVECSAKEVSGVKEVFEEAVLAVLSH